MSGNNDNEHEWGEEREAVAEEASAKGSSEHLVLKILGGAALALVAAGILASLNDIKRYIRITRM